MSTPRRARGVDHHSRRSCQAPAPAVCVFGCHAGGGWRRRNGCQARSHRPLPTTRRAARPYAVGPPYSPPQGEGLRCGDVRRRREAAATDRDRGGGGGSVMPQTGGREWRTGGRGVRCAASVRAWCACVCVCVCARVRVGAGRPAAGATGCHRSRCERWSVPASRVAGLWCLSHLTISGSRWGAADGYGCGWLGGGVGYLVDCIDSQSPRPSSSKRAPKKHTPKTSARNTG